MLECNLLLCGADKSKISSFLPEYLPSIIPVGLALSISNGGLMKGPIRYPFSSSLLTNNDTSTAYLVADNNFYIQRFESEDL